METIVSRTLSVHKEHELLQKFENAGMGDVEAQLVIESKGNALAKKLLEIIRQSGHIVSSAVERAHEIMGRNFLGVDAAVRRFKVSMTDEAAKAFSTIPFTEEELESAKNDHILVADFGISLLDLRGRVKRGLFSDQDWYDSYRWAKKAESFQWRLIRKGAVPDSFNENWNKQLSLLQANEVVPKVRQMAYAIMLNYLENDERLFKHVWVRTSDVDSDGVHVRLGHFDKYGLDVRYWYGYDCYSCIGLASARKS